jgi:hypothetical protein
VLDLPGGGHAESLFRSFVGLLLWHGGRALMARVLWHKDPLL